jgi:glycerate dehydrogenase
LCNKDPIAKIPDILLILNLFLNLKLMTPNIVFLDAFTSNPGDISFDELAGLGTFTAYDRTDLDQLESRAGHADIIIVNKFPINSQTLDKMPHLKYIVVAATGYNNIDIQTGYVKGNFSF